MKVIRVLLGLSRMTFGEIVARATHVFECMSGNPAFPKPPVSMSALKTAIEKCKAALAEVEDGSRKAIARRNQLFETLKRILRQLANYVQHNCNDDEATLKSSGFEIASSKATGPSTLSESIRSLRRGPNGGQALLTLVRVKEAASYQVRYIQRGAGGSLGGDWTMQPASNVRPPMLIENLTPGATYEFQVRALIKNGYTDWSDSVTWICT
jgi:hypothetical protein